jgi:hypothetical protein
VPTERSELHNIGTPVYKLHARADMRSAARWSRGRPCRKEVSL